MFENGPDSKRHVPTRRNELPVINGYALPELCRMHAPACVTLLSFVVDGVDKDGEPTGYKMKDRIRAAQILMDRGFGRPLDFSQMQAINQSTSDRTIDMTNEALEALINQ